MGNVRSRLAILAGLLVVVATCPIAAAEAPSGGAAPADAVVVASTPRMPAADVATAAPSFVDARTKLTPISQVPRWRAAICPQTQGLPPGYNEFISARIRAIAARAGAATDADKACKANIQVIFTDDPQKTATEVAEHARWLFGAWHATSAMHKVKFTRPIQAWYATATLDSTGRQLTDHPDAPVGLAGTNKKVFSGSRLGSERSSVFENAIVFADRGKVAGYDVGSIADYIAVLALSDVVPEEKCSSMPSIVDLLSPQCDSAKKPASITDVDLEFLKALYATEPTALGAVERNDIARRMAAGLGSP